VILVWSKATPGSYPIAGYDVWYWVKGVGAPNMIIRSTDAATTRVTITGLAPKSQFLFYVTARDTTGVRGPQSNAVFVVTGAGPNAVGTPVVVRLTPTTATLAWTPPPVVTTPIAGYDLFEMIPTPSYPLVRLLLRTTGPATTATVTGLFPGTWHVVYVAARDAAGRAVGNASENVVFRIPTSVKP
jgi:dextranase